MDNDVHNAELRRAIVRKAIKLGYDHENPTGIVKYAGAHYYVDLINDKVVLQLEAK